MNARNTGGRRTKRSVVAVRLLALGVLVVVAAPQAASAQVIARGARAPQALRGGQAGTARFGEAVRTNSAAVNANANVNANVNRAGRAAPASRAGITPGYGPFSDPIMNPFLNPYARSVNPYAATGISGEDMLLYFLAAQQRRGGRGPGGTNGLSRREGGTAAPAAAPGGPGSQRYFHRYEPNVPGRAPSSPFYRHDHGAFDRPNNGTFYRHDRFNGRGRQ